ncbi:YjbH domain-containing protein [Palleronia rufa]|uniref:YjbH domain-containing protein n=1 Tax=Palleronia rufa TaxID=1530186 RepID=UPI00055D3712|nr:YjbH domain-containing protein [Palleronia rufa]
MRQGRSARASAAAATALGLAAASAGGAWAQQSSVDLPHLNFYGMTGAIDTPTALSQPDGELAFTASTLGLNINRYTLSFQVLPRVQASFRYSGFLDFDPEGGSDTFDFYDRSFDVTVEVLKERRYLPSLKIGLQDFIGTGIQTSEYIVASKRFLDDRLTVSGGLGWGRLGGSDDLGTPFGDRPARDFGRGGNLQLEQAFRGPVSPFGSVMYRATDALTLVAEYSPDPYALETGSQGTSRNDLFTRESSLNFGASYRINDAVELGLYSLYGSEVGFRLSFNGNPYRPPVVGSLDAAPGRVAPRAPRETAPQQWSTRWRAIPDVESGLIKRLNGELAEQGLIVTGLRVVSATQVEVQYRNGYSRTQATGVGRVARAMTRIMPSAVETFRIVPETANMGTAAVVIRRSDLERLVAAPDREAALLARTGFVDDAPREAGTVLSQDVFPRLSYGIGPYVRRVFFDPNQPIRFEAGLRFQGEYEPVAGLILSTSLSTRLFGKAATDNDQASALPPVRTEFNRYAEGADFAMDRLQAAYYVKPTRTTYARVTAGYLERMFGGVSAELLWKPAASRLGLGAEVNYARKRDYGVDFGFLDYDVVTGHVSAYYELPNGFDAQIDVGRYLAGDVGATFTLSRTFRNGWEIGAYATVTDVDAETFGEGSFDKGIKVSIPVEWFTGKPSTTAIGTTLSSITRDGGARLNVNGRLYDTVVDSQKTGVTDQWGSVWR